MPVSDVNPGATSRRAATLVALTNTILSLASLSVAGGGAVYSQVASSISYILDNNYQDVTKPKSVAPKFEPAKKCGRENGRRDIRHHESLDHEKHHPPTLSRERRQFQRRSDGGGRCQRRQPSSIISRSWDRSLLLHSLSSFVIGQLV